VAVAVPVAAQHVQQRYQSQQYEEAPPVANRHYGNGTSFHHAGAPARIPPPPSPPRAANGADGYHHYAPQPQQYAPRNGYSGGGRHSGYAPQHPAAPPPVHAGAGYGAGSSGEADADEYYWEPAQPPAQPPAQHAYDAAAAVQHMSIRQQPAGRAYMQQPPPPPPPPPAVQQQPRHQQQQESRQLAAAPQMQQQQLQQQAAPVSMNGMAHAVQLAPEPPLKQRAPSPPPSPPKAPELPTAVVVPNTFADKMAQAAMARLEQRASSQRAGRASSLLSGGDMLAAARPPAAAAAPTAAPLAPPPPPPPPPPPRQDDERGSWRDTKGAGARDASDRSGGAGEPYRPSAMRPSAYGPGGGALPPPELYYPGGRSGGAGGGSDKWAAAGAGGRPDEGDRPRLKLLPRSKPAPPDAGVAVVNAHSTADDAAPRKAAAPAASVFGDAKPRELVLQSRGVDPAAVEAASHGAHRRPGGSPRHTDRGRDGSDDEDSWQTVGAGGRRTGGQRGSHPGQGGTTLLGIDDPFFGGNAGAAPPPPAGAYASNDHFNFSRHHGRGGSGGGNGFGSFGSSGSGGGVMDEEGVFRRALPTRHDDILLV